MPRELTDDEKAFCADVCARSNALRAWLDERKANSYKPEELPADIRPPTNEQISRCEVLTFESGAVQEAYFAYLSSDKKRVTTWKGDTLATLVYTGKTWKGPFGNTWTAFRASGIDGRVWHGRHNGPGMYLRMRPSKDKS